MVALWRLRKGVGFAVQGSGLDGGSYKALDGVGALIFCQMEDNVLDGGSAGCGAGQGVSVRIVLNELLRQVASTK